MTDPQPPKPPRSQKQDPLLESLLAKARPIIAEERGLNHKSRMKIQSLGKKMKIPAAVIDQALQLLHGAPPVQGAEESRYERAFAKIMQQKISEIPGKILTTRIEEKAISIGMRKYQLSEIQARNIIRRVAEEEGVPRVTLTEAERHMEQEIADLIGEDTWVTGEKKQRLIRNGKRFGVTAEQTESMIKRHLQFNFQQVQFERKLTDRLWIAAACIVVGTGFALFVFFQIQKGRKESEDIAKAREEQEKKEDPVESPDKLRSPSWWDDSLKVALQKTRLKVNGFAEIHDQLKSKTATIRSQSYLRIFDLDSGKVNPRVIRQRITAIIPGLFHAEPERDALNGFVEGFRESIRIPGGKIPDSPDFFEKSIWALELMNKIVGDDTLSDEKVVAIQEMIEPISGRKFDLFLSDEARLRKQTRSLLEAYFKHVGDICSSYPTRSPEIFNKLEELAQDHLANDRIQEFRNVFLLTFLRFEEEQWNHCSSLIKKTILDSTPTQISFFIDLMESTSVESLQIFLEQALIERSGIGNDTATIAELATELREYFEIGTKNETKDEIPQLELIDQLIFQFANKWLLQPTQLDNRKSAELMAESVYLSTLIAVQDRLDSEQLNEFIEKGFPTIDDDSYLRELTQSDSPEDTETDAAGDSEPTNNSTERFARQNLRTALEQLNQFKILSPERRIVAMGLVRRNAEQVKRLSGEDARILAEYLLSRKSPRERQIVLEALPELRHWPRLIIAMSDQLTRANFPHQTSLDVCSLLLNEDLKMAGEGWPKKLADALLTRGMEQLQTENLAPDTNAHNDPVKNLKSIIGYFYQQKAIALGVNTGQFADNDLDSLQQAIIDRYLAQLESRKKTESITKVRQQLNIVDALGRDPLSRFQLKQQATLLCLEALAPGKPTEDASPEALSKLEGLITNKLSAMPTVVGQIAENEISILLSSYRQKLKY